MALWRPTHSAAPAGGAAGTAVWAQGVTPPTLVPWLAASVTHIGGVGGAWSGWKQVTAGLGYDFRVMGAYWYWFALWSVGIVNAQFLIYSQIGIGAAASEVAVAEWAGSVVGSNPAANSDPVWLGEQETRRFQPFVVPSGTRIAFRCGSNAPFGFRFGMVLFGFDDSVTLEETAAGTYNDYTKGDLAATQGTLVTPSAGSTAVTSGAGVYTLGAWTQLIASAARDGLLTGLVQGGSVQSRGAYYELGIGGAGSEQVVNRCAGCRIPILPGPGPGLTLFAFPSEVQAGDRVAVRMAASSASVTHNVALCHEEFA